MRHTDWKTRGRWARETGQKKLNSNRKAETKKKKEIGSIPRVAKKPR